MLMLVLSHLEGTFDRKLNGKEYEGVLSTEFFFFFPDLVHIPAINLYIRIE